NLISRTHYIGFLKNLYAGIVLELEKLNKDLNEYLNGVQNILLRWIEQSLGVVPAEPPSEIKRKCDEEASKTVTRIVQGNGMSLGFRFIVIPA
ncbi:hypothetical protein RRG08_057220, partial [Elysia crispata]